MNIAARAKAKDHLLFTKRGRQTVKVPMGTEVDVAKTSSDGETTTIIVDGKKFNVPSAAVEEIITQPN